MENSLPVSQKVEHRITIWASNSTPKDTPKRSENMFLQKLVQKLFIAALFIIAKKVEITQMSINWWMGKQNVVYLCKRILFSHKKEWHTGTCYNMDEPCIHYAKLKKPVTKDHIPYDSLSMKYPE